MKLARVLLGLEAEGTRSRRSVDPYLLDPRQAARAEQAPGNGINAPDELVPEPQHQLVRVFTLLDYLGPAQVGQVEAQVKVGVAQDVQDGSHRPVEVVLSMEAHCRIFS